nr:bestrophin [Candidatus Pantoea persica]
MKSCVGSSWCRYGVQDSTAFAIALEHRYKGLRAPHKIKMAVSGCTRECAEAQSKDIGVIATEKGWNLYVCGNGGMKPRHVDLFASDLDDETLIRYVDRILMFYVHTADRLQRTSVWMVNQEGGLDYLRQVVIEDRLGIGATLEAEMQQVSARGKAAESPQNPFSPAHHDRSSPSSQVRSFVRLARLSAARYFFSSVSQPADVAAGACPAQRV